MTSTALQHAPAPDGFSRAYLLARRLLHTELARVTQRVGDAAARLPGPGGVAARLMSNTPGKMIRPLLVGLVHRAHGGAGGPLCARAAAVVETIHLSTLLHDDVVDAAPQRRGHPSANAVMGNPAAVLGGDALVVAALSEAEALGTLPVRRALLALKQLVEGELIQLGKRRDASITPQQALAVANLKTGALMRLCAELGVLTAGGTEDVAVAWGDAFARVGVAFQVLDDLLDLAGDPGSLGKAVGADIAQGTVSYPVALAMERSPMHGRALAASFVRHEGPEVLGRLVHHALARTGALPDAVAHAERELEAAIALVALTRVSRARTVLLAVLHGMSRRAR